MSHYCCHHCFSPGYHWFRHWLRFQVLNDALREFPWYFWSFIPEKHSSIPLKKARKNSIFLTSSSHVLHESWIYNFFHEILCFIFLVLQKLESFTTSKTDGHLLRQKVRQKISVIITNTCVFVVFKTKRELKCQNELFF